MFVFMFSHDLLTPTKFLTTSLIQHHLPEIVNVYFHIMESKVLLCILWTTFTGKGKISYSILWIFTQDSDPITDT